MNKVIKKDVIINNKCFFENLNVAEEALFSLKVLKNSNKIVFINQKLYHYVNIPSGQHTKGNNDPWFCLCKIMKKYLIESKEYEEYKLSLNGLIVRSLNISIYRLSSNTFFEFKKNVKTKMANYKIEFGTFDKLENVDKKTRLISFLLKIKFFLIIYLLCKIRNKMVKK